MPYSVKLKQKYIMKTKFLLVMFIVPIILLVSKENEYTILRTIAALVLNVILWTEVFHQVTVIIFRKHMLLKDNGKYLSNQFANIIRQTLYLSIVLIMYLIAIIDLFSLGTVLGVLGLFLLLYKLTPKPIIISKNYFLHKNQIYLTKAFKEYSKIEDNKIKCVMHNNHEMIINVPNIYHSKLLETLNNTLYLEENDLEHIDSSQHTVKISIPRILLNYLSILLVLSILSFPLVIEAVFPVLNSDDQETEYFMNFMSILLILSGIINGYITRFLVTTTNIIEFEHYKLLLHKSIRVLFLLGILTLAYYHIFKLEHFVIFFISNCVLLLYWISTVVLYYKFISKKRIS